MKPAMFLIFCFFMPLNLFATPSPLTGKYIDNHVHVACYGFNSKCYVSERMMNSYKLPVYERLFNFSYDEARKHGDGILFKKIHAQVQESKFIKQVVLLAMDEVYSESGEIKKDETEYYVPNTFVATHAKKFNTLLFGASVHPYRKDALQELERVKANGAVLIKLLPAIQHFHADKKSLTAYYKKLVQLKLPLLIHMDDEHSFSKTKDIYSNPAKLELPLSLGVTVICSHAASLGQRSGQETFDILLNLKNKYSNLYADISALTQARTRHGHIKKIVAEPRWKDRTLYGSDWPLTHQVLSSPLYYVFDLGVAKSWELFRTKNTWDRDVLIKKAFGVTEDVFLRTEQLLKL